MKISKRLKVIASMVDDNSSVIDVGCDHGLLSIYLVKECHVKVLATDVSKNALKNAIENIYEYGLENDIETILTDGLAGLDIKGKTIIICGMGTRTIRLIIENIKEYNMKEFIIQSNNEVDELRKFMINRGFIISDEKFVTERKRSYVLIKFKLGNQKYKKTDYLVGPILKNTCPHYLKYLITNKIQVLSSIPKRYFIRRIKIIVQIMQIKKEIKNN